MATKKTFKKKAVTTGNKPSGNSEWKPTFGEGAKPASYVTKMVTGFSKGKTDEVIMIGDKLSEVAKALAVKFKLENEADLRVINALLRAANGTGCNSLDDVSPSQKRFGAVCSEIEKISAVNLKNRKSFADKVDEENRAKAEAKGNALKASQEADAKIGSKLVAITSQTQDAISASLSKIEGITLDKDEGKFILNESLSDSSIAEGFSTISGMVNKVDGMRESFTMMEARYAQAIDDIGKNWALFFNPDDDDQVKSIRRIKQAVNSLNRMDKYGVQMPGASITTIRCVMEANYNKENEDDNKARINKVVDILCNAYEKDGKYPPLNAVRNIVSENKVQGGAKRHTHIYLFSEEGTVKSVGMDTFNAGMHAIAFVTIHVGSMSIIVDDKDPAKIESPDDELLKLAAENAPEKPNEPEEEKIEKVAVPEVVVVKEPAKETEDDWNDGDSASEEPVAEAEEAEEEDDDEDWS